MRVLVTGSGGFIGRYVLATLRAAGHEGVRFDLAGGSDVRDPRRVREAADGCDHVIHLAGMLGTAELFGAAHEAIDVNVHGTLNVLQACEARGLGYTGITMPDCWDNVYQATKLCAQRLAASWHHHQGVPVSHVRAFNAYGPGQKLGPVQKIVPTFAHRAWRGEPLPVWGDGRQLVDLVPAEDIARMLCAAIAFGGNEVFDAGTGHGQAVADVARQAIAQSGSGSVIEYLPMRKGEYPADVVAKGEGWDLLGWRPVFSAESLAGTVDWYREAR